MSSDLPFRHCIIELRILKANILISDVALARKASKARFSAGCRRPPAAQHDRQGIADVILWRQFRSGTVIIVVEVEKEASARRVLFLAS